MNAERLLDQANNVYIEIQEMRTLNYLTGQPISKPTNRITVRDDSDEVVIKDFRTFEETKNFFSMNSYRDILLKAGQIEGNPEKYVGIAETSGGFFLTDMAYDVDSLDTFRLSF